MSTHSYGVDPRALVLTAHEMVDRRGMVAALNSVRESGRVAFVLGHAAHVHN